MIHIDPYMTSNQHTTLTRDIQAIQIPEGNTQTLVEGTEVVITQSLGGTFTIHCQDSRRLFRIATEDSDALGLGAESLAELAGKEPESVEGTLDERVWSVLKTCYDPEIPVNIVDLGLIYSMEISGEEGQHRIDVKMTLTAPGCGMGPTIAADAQGKIVSIPEVKDAHVEVVWEPAWNPAMISPEGKNKLGIE